MLTDLDVTAVSVDGKSVTDCKIAENGQKEWTFSFTAEHYGKVTAKVILSNEEGAESKPFESPELTVNSLPVSERVRSISWENDSIKQNSTAILKIITDLDVSSVSVDGAKVAECETVYTDGTPYRDGIKIWTYSFKAEKAGTVVCNIAVFDAEGETASLSSPKLEVKKLSILERFREFINKIIAFWRGLF